MLIVLQDETKGKPVIEFVGLRPKMYSFRTCDAVIGNVEPRIYTKQIGKGITRAALKQIPHETYLAMFREGEQQIVINRRIGSQLHNIYSLEFRKRGIVPYDDKRFLLADLADGQPNPNTHAFGHYSIETAEFPEPEQPPAGADMVVEVREPPPSRNQRWEARLARKHKRAVKVADQELSDDNEVIAAGPEFAVLQRAAETRPGGTRHMMNVIDRLIADTRAMEAAAPPCHPGAGPSRHPTLESVFQEAQEDSDSENEVDRPHHDPFGIRARHRLALEGEDGRPVSPDAEEDGCGFEQNDMELITILCSFPHRSAPFRSDTDEDDDDDGCGLSNNKRVLTIVIAHFLTGLRRFCGRRLWERTTTTTPLTKMTNMASLIMTRYKLKLIMDILIYDFFSFNG